MSSVIKQLPIYSYFNYIYNHPIYFEPCNLIILHIHPFTYPSIYPTIHPFIYFLSLPTHQSSFHPSS